jgi:transcriptional regulator with XRE-family HTH domain
MSLGEKLRQFGLKKFGSLTKFADNMEMSLPSLSRYLNNTREPGTGILKKLLVLGCDINWLLSEDLADRTMNEQTAKYDPDKIRVLELESENEALKTQISDIQRAAKLINEAMNKK